MSIKIFSLKTSIIILGLILFQSLILTQNKSQAISDKQLIKPKKLAEILSDSHSEKPLIYHVGVSYQFTNAHIPGAKYTGMAATSEGIEILKKEVKKVPRNKNIILYCGCCPWENCPNVRPAYKVLEDMGFTKIMVLYIANNFQKDWIDKKYPVQKK